MAQSELTQKEVILPDAVENVGSSRELEPEEILAPLRQAALTLDAAGSPCLSCIFEAIRCGPNHQSG